MEHPRADAEFRPLDRPFVSEKPKLRKIIASANLTGLANDTKWNELIQAMRTRGGDRWCPSFRFNCIDTDYISRWDCEWWHHLPFPLMSVRWMDLSFIEEKEKKGRLLDSEYIDHSKSIEVMLSEIGFDFKKGEKAIRIFGYAPRDISDFPPLKNEEAYQDSAHNSGGCAPSA